MFLKIAAAVVFVSITLPVSLGQQAVSGRFSIPVTIMHDSGSDSDEARRADLDLAAQQSMSVAADKMVQLTEVQLWLSALGSVALLVTIALALRANGIAKRAIEADTRPWLVISSVNLEPIESFIDDNGRLSIVPRLKVTLGNIGRTPAQMVSLGVRLEKKGTETSPYTVVNGAYARKFADVVVPGDEPSHSLFFIADLDEVYEGGSISMVIRASYQDGMKKRETIQLYWICDSVFEGTSQGLSRGRFSVDQPAQCELLLVHTVVMT